MKRIKPEFYDEQNTTKKHFNFSILVVAIFLAINLITLLFYIVNNKNNYEFILSKEFNHVVIRYSEQDEEVIEEIGDTLDSAFVNLSDFLQPLSIDQKIIIDIYPSKKKFNIASKYTEDWVLGIVVSGRNIYLISPNAEDIDLDIEKVKTIAVHELTHVFINNILSSPDIDWLSESIALYEAKQFLDPKEVEFIKNGNYPTIQELKTNREKDIYVVGYTITEFIIDTWGRDKLIDLIVFNGNTQVAFGMSVVDFQRNWIKYINDKYLD